VNVVLILLLFLIIMLFMVILAIVMLIVIVTVVLVVVMVAAMSRPRIPIGTFGEITFINRANGRVEARARYRDWDGQTRLIQATASSRPAPRSR